MMWYKLLGWFRKTIQIKQLDNEPKISISAIDDFKLTSDPTQLGLKFPPKQSRPKEKISSLAVQKELPLENDSAISNKHKLDLQKNSPNLNLIKKNTNTLADQGTRIR